MATQHDSTEESEAAKLGDELLRSRMVIIGLHSGAVERDNRAMFEALRKNCLSCGDRGACLADLKRDPTNQVWEAYCPNSGALTTLVEVTEASQ